MRLRVCHLLILRDMNASVLSVGDDREELIIDELGASFLAAQEE
jgi:hypothetical protein